MKNLVLMSVITLICAGCSKQPTQTYKEKIAAYEEEIIQNQLKIVTDNANKAGQSNDSNVVTINDYNENDLDNITNTIPVEPKINTDTAIMAGHNH